LKIVLVIFLLILGLMLIIFSGFLAKVGRRINEALWEIFRDATPKGSKRQAFAREFYHTDKDSLYIWYYRIFGILFFIFACLGSLVILGVIK
jgi:hypothetical protein